MDAKLEHTSRIHIPPSRFCSVHKMLPDDAVVVLYAELYVPIVINLCDAKHNYALACH